MKLIVRLRQKLAKDDRDNATRAARRLSISEFTQDNFTVVALIDPDTTRIASVGVSKRMPGDAANDMIGYNLALSRAYASFFKKNGFKQD